MAGNPLRFLVSPWPWRSLAYLVSGLVTGMLWLLLAIVLVVAGTVLAPVGAGIVLLLCVPLSAVGLGAVDRRRLRLLDPRPAPSPHRDPPAAGLRPWLRFRLGEVATWRELGHAVLAGLLSVAAVTVPVVLFVGAVVQAGAPMLVGQGDRLMYGAAGTVDTRHEAWPVAAAGVLMGLLGLYAMTVAAAARAALDRALLVRPVEEELVDVRASRARMADAFEAERRRIERDLHDGAQQRLTGLIMTLGLAKLDGGGEWAGKAQDEARAALAELRDLVRGIHPSVLTDRGLRAAVESLAERSAVPVEVDVDLPGRPPEAVESAAYFVVAEALANVAKHSGASRARVSARRSGGALRVEVWDDGTGGAASGRDGGSGGGGSGSGLQGLADRVAVHDGTLRLSSPPGGPTLLRVEIPCES
ncbi:sensor histidine kinase [Actinomadura sp. WMMB 499]|nr:sensor histidine kinase [Actinomadura sp. WMMB 499]